MQISPHISLACRAPLAIALLALAGTCALAAPVSGIQGNQGGTLWSTSVTTPLTATNSTELLAFTVGGVTYSTGVHDGMVDGSFTAADFQALTVPALTPNASTLTAWGVDMTVPPEAGYPALTWFLSDGTQGLELATAVFNAPNQNVDFPIAIPSTADLTLPAIVTTQVGQPGTQDVYVFIDSSGGEVGTPITVNYGGVDKVGDIHWQFRSHTGGSSTQEAGTRALRMQAYTLANFGLTDTTVGAVVAFRQQLSGQSDLAFVAYNRDLIQLQAPDLAIDLANLTTPMPLGAAYTGSFSCTNLGPISANAGTTCTVSGLPTGLAPGACTISGGGTWVAGDAIPAGNTVTCAVTGTPTVAGSATVSGTTSGSNTTTVGGAPVTTPDSDPSNNTDGISLSVIAPDMQVTNVNLPAGTEGEAYSGSFTCSNQGTAPAAAATCAPTGLPDWAVVACSPSPPVASLAVDDTISCTVTGTPTTGSNGTTLVTITTGTSSTELDATNNTGTGSIAIAGVPNVVIDLTDLPPTGTVNQPYNGTFTCTNSGTAGADAAACSVAGLPDGVTAGACTISPDGDDWTSPGAIAVDQIVICEVSGTPTDAGESPVTGTGGTSTATTTVTVSAAAAAALTPVPTMAQWSLLLMGALLGLLGAARLRRAN